MKRSPFVLLLSIVLALPSAAAGDRRDEGLPSNVSVFPAVLLSDRTALIKSIHDERVAEIQVRVGQRVGKGEPLLRLVDDEERLELERAAALLDRVRAESARTKRLHEEEQVSDVLLEQTQTDLRLAEADFKLAQIRLAERTVRAPFKGVVAERYVDQGASVQIGDPLVRVTALTPLRVEAVLPEDMLPRLQQSKEIVVYLDSPSVTMRLPLRPYPFVVDPASGTFLLHVELDNRDHRLVPGVSCRIGIAEPQEESR